MLDTGSLEDSGGRLVLALYLSGSLPDQPFLKDGNIVPRGGAGIP